MRGLSLVLDNEINASPKDRLVPPALPPTLAKNFHPPGRLVQEAFLDNLIGACSSFMSTIGSLVGDDQSCLFHGPSHWQNMYLTQFAQRIVDMMLRMTKEMWSGNMLLLYARWTDVS